MRLVGDGPFLRKPLKVLHALIFCYACVHDARARVRRVRTPSRTGRQNIGPAVLMHG